MSTREREGFLRAIVENPDDDTPRLVYADWLDEHGQPDRARFIRLQCELARVTYFERDPAAVEEAEDLLARHRADWLAELGLPSRPASGRAPTFCRGFVEEAELPAARFLREGERLVSRTPLRHLKLTGLRDRMRKVSACPALAGVRSLALHGERLDDRAVQALAGSPHIRRLERLDLGDNLIGPAGAAAVLEGGPSLTDVEFQGNRLGPEGAAAVAGSPAMIHHLALRLGRNEIGPAGARAIAESHYLGAVVEADLRENRLGFRGARALAGSVSLRPRVLRLLGNGLGDRGVAALANGLLVGMVESLDLEANRVGDAGVVALARSAVLGRLRSLDLTDNPVTDRGALALRDGLPALEGLTLDGTRVTGAVLTRLFGREAVMGQLVGRGRGETPRSGHGG